MLRVSTWAHPFFRGDVAALFHALTFQVAFLPADTARALLAHRNAARSSMEWSGDFGPETVAGLFQEGFLVTTDRDESRDLETLRHSLGASHSLDLMYLLVADGCNLRCAYCFEEAPAAPNFRARVMNERTVIAAIDRFAVLTAKYGNPQAEKLIQLYGGEPLLNRRAVRRAITRVAECQALGTLPSATRIVMVTNGLLLDEPFIRYLAEHRVAIGISIDGPAGINNAHRIPKQAGVDTFASARRAYELARAAGIEVGISATLTPEVIADFDTVLDFFINDLRVENGMSFNILHYTPAMPVGEEYFAAAADCLIRAFERFRKLGIYEDRMMRKVEAFASRQPIFIDCGIGGNQIVVAPDGSIGVCQDFVKPRTYFRGSVHSDEDPVAVGLFDEWRLRSPLSMPACHPCPAVAFCGGGCPASVELATGDRWQIDRRVCPHSLRSLEWLIWQTYAEAVA
jgi:uncharacterized protein